MMRWEFMRWVRVRVWEVDNIIVEYKKKKDRCKVWLHENRVWYNSLDMWSDVVHFSCILGSDSSHCIVQNEIGAKGLGLEVVFILSIPMLL